ncbi:hypothetical protein NP233_g12132 [Leucocoprinus birnbaumii]|uniref:Uncharacterized protein n=1 Tax=Leucocoprinus birnbaumii TaxID=56174 RepID=A0AAD5YQ96_9AGAR|nr:hypothetical protein NP233_g12132 [Leucocoprinus birnbaumii]
MQPRHGTSQDQVADQQPPSHTADKVEPVPHVADTSRNHGEIGGHTDNDQNVVKEAGGHESHAACSQPMKRKRALSKKRVLTLEDCEKITEDMEERLRAMQESGPPVRRWLPPEVRGEVAIRRRRKPGYGPSSIDHRP